MLEKVKPNDFSSREIEFDIIPKNFQKCINISSMIHNLYESLNNIINQRK